MFPQRASCCGCTPLVGSLCRTGLVGCNDAASPTRDASLARGVATEVVARYDGGYRNGRSASAIRRNRT
jgi:hypothetical protein